MIVLDDSDIWLLILIFELVFALFFFLFLLLVFLLVFSPCLLVLFLLLLQLSLLFHLVYPFPLPYLIVPNDSLSHFIVIRVHKLAQNFLLFFILPFELFVEDLHLADLSTQLQEICFETCFLRAQSF